MLDQYHSAKERWGGIHLKIDAWLTERRQLIVQYYDLTTAQPLRTDGPSLGERVQSFCQVMMDYCSAGHFEIYENLMTEAREYDDGGVELGERLVPQLDLLTSRCVDFNDAFDSNCTLDQLAGLPAALSQLGEVLEERFQLEDQLIERLHNAHRELVA